MNLWKIEEALRLVNNGKYGELEQLLQKERIKELLRMKAEIDQKLHDAGPSVPWC